MKLIHPSVSLIKETNPFKKIEKVGRTCYKSSSEMTEETARKFYTSLTSRKHTAMVEHATFVFEVSGETYEYLHGHKFLNYTYNPEVHRYLISGNLRALNECNEPILLKVLYNIDPMLVYTNVDFNLAEEELPEFASIWHINNIQELTNLSKEEYMAHAYFTFHFICDRGVTHEIVRHRPASFAQESTRYCNYAKDKFGGEISIIYPANYDEWADIAKHHFVQAMEKCETEYRILTANGLTAQEARAVLPNALKTELIMTANAKEFEHFFDLRSKGVTGAPHPDMKYVADMAYTLYSVEKFSLIGLL